MGACPRIYPVGRDNKVMLVTQRLDIIDFGLEFQLHAERDSAFLKKLQQFSTADAAKTVAGRHKPFATMHERDIVPIGKKLLDGFGADRIIVLQVRQRLVGKHHTPSERVVGAIALNHGDVV